MTVCVGGVPATGSACSRSGNAGSACSPRWCCVTAACGFQAAIDLLAAGAIPVDELITEIVPLVEAEAAFQALTARGTEKVKILLAP